MTALKKVRNPEITSREINAKEARNILLVAIDEDDKPQTAEDPNSRLV